MKWKINISDRSDILRKEECHARNQLLMAKERERYIGESDCIQLVLGPMK